MDRSVIRSYGTGQDHNMAGVQQHTVVPHAVDGSWLSAFGECIDSDHQANSGTV